MSILQGNAEQTKTIQGQTARPGIRRDNAKMPINRKFPPPLKTSRSTKNSVDIELIWPTTTTVDEIAQLQSWLGHSSQPNLFQCLLQKEGGRLPGALVAIHSIHST